MSATCISERGSSEQVAGCAKRRLVVCADDFGLNDGVNAAIFDLAAKHRISATSCMVGGAAWQQGAARLRDMVTKIRIDIGLHLDFTEHPLRPESAKPLRALIPAAFSGRLDPISVRAEIESQLDDFEARLGQQPDHIDGHQHVHQLPIIRDELLAVLRRRYRPSSLWIRSTHRPRTATGKARREFKSWLIETLGGLALDTSAKADGFRQNNHLHGVYDFSSSTSYTSLFDRWLADAEDLDLLMCHPGCGSASTDRIATARREEYEFLSGEDFPSRLASAGLTVTRLGATR